MCLLDGADLINSKSCQCCSNNGPVRCATWHGWKKLSQIGYEYPELLLNRIFDRPFGAVKFSSRPGRNEHFRRQEASKREPSSIFHVRRPKRAGSSTFDVRRPEASTLRITFHSALLYKILAGSTPAGKRDTVSPKYDLSCAFSLLNACPCLRRLQG